MKSYSIGRDMACDIVMNDQSDVISRRHAVLTVSSSGKMTITDQSSNGTYVNGIKISPNVAVPVTRKDSVSFAHVATLDWNMIPKSRMWVNYLLIGLGVSAVAALIVLLLTREHTPYNRPNGGEPIAVDTLKSQSKADSLKVEPVKPKTDTVKPQTDTVKNKPQTESQSKEQKANSQNNKQSKKQHKKQNDNNSNNDNPKPKTDSVKNSPRPFGV